MLKQLLAEEALDVGDELVRVDGSEEVPVDAERFSPCRALQMTGSTAEDDRNVRPDEPDFPDEQEARHGSQFMFGDDEVVILGT